MNHIEWFHQFQEALRIAESNNSDAVAAAKRLLQKTRRIAKASVTDWHHGEVLGYLAFLAEEAGESKKAVREYLRLAKLYRQKFQQYGHGLASALESAGVAALRARETRTALRVARQVVRLRADFPYFSKATETLIAALAEDDRARNRRARMSKRRRATTRGRRR